MGVPGIFAVPLFFFCRGNRFFSSTFLLLHLCSIKDGNVSRWATLASNLMETARPTPTEEIDDVLTIHRKKKITIKPTPLLLYMIFFSCHPSTHTQRLLFFPAKWKECRVLAIDRWQKRPPPGGAWKGKKEKKKNNFLWYYSNQLGYKRACCVHFVSYADSQYYPTARSREYGM